MLFQSRIGTFCHPQDTQLISWQLSQEIGSRDITRLTTWTPCHSNAEPRMLICASPLQHHVSSTIPREPTLSYLFGISRFTDPRYKFSLVLKLRTPNPDPPGSRDTCPYSDRWFSLNREIVIRGFNESALLLVNRRVLNLEGC